MSLVEAIRHAVEANRLPRVWTTAHLLECPELAAAFGESTLKTDPPNRSISPCGEEAGNPVKTGKAAPVYTRFQPSNNDRPRKPLWFCLQDHNEPGDPEAYNDAFPAAWLAGMTQVVPMAAQPNADVAERFARVLDILEAGRHADGLAALADVVRRGYCDTDLTDRVHWGVLFWLAGRTLRALAQLEESFRAFDHALEWFVEHPEPGDRHCQDTRGLLDLDNAIDVLRFETTKARHAVVMEQAYRDGELDGQELTALANDYAGCDTKEKFLYLGLVSHALKDADMHNRIVQGMRDANLPEIDINYVSGASYTIQAGVPVKVVVQPGALAPTPGVYFPALPDKSEGVHDLAALADNLDTAYRVVMPSMFLKRFQFEKWLGHGYFGSTMLALDRESFEKVAIKRLRVRLDLDQDPETFAANVGRLPDTGGHHGLVEIREAGIDDSFLTLRQPYVVMEYVPGASLRQVLKEQPQLPLAYRFAWMLGIAAAMAHLQQGAMRHRDFKPENIYVSSAGPFPENPTMKELEDRGGLKVGDVGIAGLYEGLPSERVAQGSDASVAYFAPEQFPPRLVRSNRSEVYTLGLLLHEILLGFHPFWAPGKPVDDGVLAKMKAGVKFEDPPPLFQVIARCLAWDPAQRYAHAEEAAQALANALQA